MNTNFHNSFTARFHRKFSIDLLWRLPLTLVVLLHYLVKSENPIYICFSKTNHSSSHIFSLRPLCGRLTFWIWTLSTTQRGGSYKSVHTSTTGSRTWKSCASMSRRNGTVWTRKWLTTRSVNGQATDSLHCSRWRTFWTFTLNITAFVHILINMFWTLLTLLNVKQINFSCTSYSLAVIVNFPISQDSVAT